MAGGAYRDAGAAIERAEALEREVEELRAEIVRLGSETRLNAKAPTRPPPDVERLQNELVDLRAENEVLRSQLKSDGSEQRDIIELRRLLAEAADERRDLEARVRGADEAGAAKVSRIALERDALATDVVALRAEVARLESVIAEARKRASAPPPPPPPPVDAAPKGDEREQLIARMQREAARVHEELVDLRTQNELLRSAIATLEGEA